MNNCDSNSVIKKSDNEANTKDTGTGDLPASYSMSPVSSSVTFTPAARGYNVIEFADTAFEITATSNSDLSTATSLVTQMRYFNDDDDVVANSQIVDVHSVPKISNSPPPNQLECNDIETTSSCVNELATYTAESGIMISPLKGAQPGTFTDELVTRSGCDNVEGFNESGGNIFSNFQSRRVSFPKSDHELVTGYLEPANPWEHALHTNGIPEITELYINSCQKHNTEPLSSVLDHIHTLQVNKSVRQSCFSLRGTKLKPEDCEALEEIFKRIQYEVIDISSCQLNETAAGALFDMIEYYEAANELDISDNPEMTSRGWTSCISLIRRSRELQILHAQGNPLSEANSINLGKSLLQSCLHTIKLEHCGLRGNPIYNLCMGLRRNTSIKELWLAHNDLSQNDAENIADLIKANAYLQFLDVSNNDIRDVGLKYIVLALKYQSTKLIYLSPPSSDESQDSPSIERNITKCDVQRGSSEEICDKFKLARNQSVSGRSMLDTLLTKSKEEESSSKRASDNQENQIQKECNMDDDDDIFDSPSNIVCSGVVDCQAYAPQAECNENNNPHVITENEEDQNLNSATKALDVNKNSRLDDFEETQSADSAFESASEGDISKHLSEDYSRLLSFESTRIDLSKENSDLSTSLPAPSSLGNNITNSINISPTAVTTPISSCRARSHSSDSLSSDTSLDGSTSSSPGTTFSQKMNEKLTKNDTLTRQKQFDVPQKNTKIPNGLKAIVLWNNNLTKESGDYIASLLDTTSTLELINIGKNILSNDFVAKIRISLSHNSSITDLGLQSAHLSCAGIKTLSSILQFGGNTTLRRIDIRDNNIQVDSLNSLAEALKSNKSVTQIDIDDVPKRISVGNDAQFHYTRLLHTIRSLCVSNETSPNETAENTSTLGLPHRRGGGCYLNSRKISLTCQSVPLMKTEAPTKVESKKRGTTRLRSPLPSPPTISPSSSPVPSPLKSRFQVFRVVESDVANMSSSLPNTTLSLPSTSLKDDPSKQKIQQLSLSPRSRFRVVRIDDDPIRPVVPIVRSVPPTSSSSNKFSTRTIEENPTSTDFIELKPNIIANSTNSFLREESTSPDNDITLTKPNNTILMSPLKENHSNLIDFDDEEICKASVASAVPQRQRKTSWISNTSCPTTVDKLLSIFHHPGNLLRRSPESIPSLEGQEPLTPQPSHSPTPASSHTVAVRKQSPPSTLFPWIADAASQETLSNTSSSFFDAATKQIRDIADFGKQVFRHNIAFGNETAITAAPFENSSIPSCDCDIIPSDVKLEIKENISPEHTITEGQLIQLQKPVTQSSNFIPEHSPKNVSTGNVDENRT